jgi:hypothetical protein
LDKDYLIEYFQMCQGNDSPNELYFYINTNAKREIFAPIFGKYESYFIRESEIKTLSDLDFSKISKPNFFQIVRNGDIGYLKIKCQEPGMLKHTFFEIKTSSSSNILNSGSIYYLGKAELQSTYALDKILVSKIVHFKIYAFWL